MNQLKIDLNVLTMYKDAESLGARLTIPTIAERLPYTQHAVRAAIARLKAADYLQGSRVMQLTDSGRDVVPAERRLSLIESTDELLTPPNPRTEASHLSTQPSVYVPQERKLSEVLAGRYMVDAAQLAKTIKDNIISITAGDPPATNEELFMVMTVCNTYNLNPFIRHIHAFRSQGKLQTPLGFDGWVHIANGRPEFLGVSYEHPPVEDMVVKNGKHVFPWIKATCHIKGKADTVVYAFADEWMQGPNWNKHPNHRLRMKAYAMAVREALGIALPDEVDAEHIVFAEQESHQQAFNGTADSVDALVSRMAREEKPWLPTFDEQEREAQESFDMEGSGIQPEDEFKPEEHGLVENNE